MKIWLTEEDDYVCPLSTETQRLALEELRETKSAREQALTQLRDLIKSNAKITNCRLDANFLLRFLRVKKFSVIQAGEALERYLLLRQTFGVAFSRLDFTITAMDELLSLGYIFALPERDSMGRRVVFARPGVFDPHKYDKDDMCRIHGITYETLLEDEENQVRGFVHVADGARVGFPHLTLFTPREAVRIVKNGERTLPMRHKEGHTFNAHPSLKFALDFGMSLISEKIRKRVKIYTSLSEVHKIVDAKLMPKEYGGTIPMAEMIALWREELKAQRTKIMSHDSMSVCEEMFTEQAKTGAVSALKNVNRCATFLDNGIMGVNGTFRKLELD